MTRYELALLVHLLGVAVLAAGMGAAGVALELARRREPPAEVAVLLGAARVGVLLVAAGSLALLVGGFWLMEIGAYDLADRWLATSLGLFVLAALLGTLGGRRPRRARLHAERLTRKGAPADETLRRLLDDPMALTLNYASALLMATILALMIIKP